MKILISVLNFLMFISLIFMILFGIIFSKNDNIVKALKAGQRINISADAFKKFVLTNENVAQVQNNSEDQISSDNKNNNKNNLTLSHEENDMQKNINEQNLNTSEINHYNKNIIVFVFNIDSSSDDLFDIISTLPNEIALGFNSPNGRLLKKIEDWKNQGAKNNLFVYLPIEGDMFISNIQSNIRILSNQKSKKENENDLNSIIKNLKNFSGFYLDITRMFSGEINVASAVIDYLRNNKQYYLINSNSTSSDELVNYLYSSWVNFINLDKRIMGGFKENEALSFLQKMCLIEDDKTSNIENLKNIIQNSDYCVIGIEGTKDNINALNLWLFDLSKNNVKLISMDQLEKITNQNQDNQNKNEHLDNSNKSQNNLNDITKCKPKIKNDSILNEIVPGS